MTEAIATINTQNAYTSESDDDSEEQLNISKIEYNGFVFDGMEAFSKRDFTNAIKNYEGALKIAISFNDIDKLCSTKWYNYLTTFLMKLVTWQSYIFILMISNDHYLCLMNVLELYGICKIIIRSLIIKWQCLLEFW